MRNLLTRKQLDEIDTINSLKGNYVNPEYLKQLTDNYRSVLNYFDKMDSRMDPDFVDEEIIKFYKKL